MKFVPVKWFCSLKPVLWTDSNSTGRGPCSADCNNLFKHHLIPVLVSFPFQFRNPDPRRVDTEEDVPTDPERGSTERPARLAAASSRRCSRPREGAPWPEAVSKPTVAASRPSTGRSSTSGRSQTSSEPSVAASRPSSAHCRSPSDHTTCCFSE